MSIDIRSSGDIAYSVIKLSGRGEEQGGGMAELRHLFPDGEANDMNFVMFSTSGTHGSYTTIEEIEDRIRRFGDGHPPEDAEDDDAASRRLTVVVVHPRLAALRYGNVDVTAEDLPFLKKLRETSRKVMKDINKP